MPLSTPTSSLTDISAELYEPATTTHNGGVTGSENRKQLYSGNRKSKYGHINGGNSNNNNGSDCDSKDSVQSSKFICCAVNIRSCVSTVSKRRNGGLTQFLALANKNNNGSIFSRPTASGKRLLIRFSNSSVQTNVSKKMSTVCSSIPTVMNREKRNMNPTSAMCKNKSYSQGEHDMAFLSEVVHQLPSVTNEVQSDFSADDLNISDDSVLDDLYTGLPPCQFRKSNLSIAARRTEAEVPMGLLRPDYAYMVKKPILRRVARIRRPSRKQRRVSLIRSQSRSGLKSRFRRFRRRGSRRRSLRRRRSRSKRVRGVPSSRKRLYRTSRMLASEPLYSESESSDTSTTVMCPTVARPSKSILRNRSQQSVLIRNQPSSIQVGNNAVIESTNIPIFGHIKSKSKVAVSASNFNHSNKSNNNNTNRKRRKRRVTTDKSSIASDVECIYDDMGNVLFEILPYSKRATHKPRRPKKTSWLDSLPSDTEDSDKSVLTDSHVSSAATATASNITTVRSQERRVKTTRASKHSTKGECSIIDALPQEHYTEALSTSMAQLFDRISMNEMHRSTPSRGYRDSQISEGDIFKYNIGWENPLRCKTKSGSRKELNAHSTYASTDPVNVNIFNKPLMPHKRRIKHNNHYHTSPSQSERLWHSNNNCNNNTTKTSDEESTTSSSYPGSRTTAGSGTTTSYPGSRTTTGANNYATVNKGRKKSSLSSEETSSSDEPQSQQLLKVPATGNRKGRKARLVVQSNVQLETMCKDGLKHLTYQGRILCSLKKEIAAGLKSAGLKVKSGLENYIPLWKHLKKGEALRLPPIVILDNHNRVIEYHPGGSM